jgi:hypothetical protein
MDTGVVDARLTWTADGEVVSLKLAIPKRGVTVSVRTDTMQDPG